MQDILNELTLLIEALVNSPYTALIAITLSIVGFISTIYYRRKSKKFKHLGCTIVGNNIVKDRHVFFPKLSILYDEEELNSLTISKVRIKNLGNEVIRKEDIAPSDPILVTVNSESSEQILDCSLIESTNVANNFVCSLDDQTVYIDFDFVEPKEAAYCQIIHTGSSHQVLKVSGTVIDAKKPFRSDDPLQILDKPFFRLMNKYPLVVGSFIFLAFAIINVLLALGLTTSIAVRGLCMIPAVIIILALLRVVIKNRGFREKDKDETSEIFLQEIMRATLMHKKIADE